MLAAIVRASGAVPGMTSTDGVVIGDETVERGDFSGPGGARTALRDPRVEVGVLEVARGGILRRGLGLPLATAAAVTNVAADHLGDYGIDTVPDLAQVKFVVAKALGAGGALRDEPRRRTLPPRGRTAGQASGGARRARRLDRTPTPAACPMDLPLRSWTGTSPGEKPLARGHPLWMSRRFPPPEAALARYNVRNAHDRPPGSRTRSGSATAPSPEASRASRARRRRTPVAATSSPSAARRHSWTSRTTRHGVQALAETVAALPAERRLVLLSQPGDRTDREIRAFASALGALGADRYVVTELPGYLRGREPGVTPALLREALLASGAAPEAIREAADPAAGVPRGARVGRAGRPAAAPRPQPPRRCAGSRPRGGRHPGVAGEGCEMEGCGPRGPEAAPLRAGRQRP